ncbi:cation-transporting P-type ATPase, partial [Nanoarchaeota archaeon NZ13-N]
VGVVVIPEGLPTALTIIYTFALDRLKNKGLLVKKQSLVETLGSVDVILTDKTGTLTYNKHTVRKFWFNNKIYSVTGIGYSKKGEILLNNKKVDNKELEIFLEALTNSVETNIIEENNEIKIIGDPLEAALIFLARKAGKETYYEKIRLLEFDSIRKRMSIVIKKDNKYIAFVKGAPEKVLEISKFIYLNGRKVDIEKYRNRIREVFEEFAKEGFRTLAFGYKELKSLDEEIEKDIVFLGIVGIEDPVREDAIDAIKFAKEAGIDVYIVTGDHPLTAVFVGRKVGLGEKFILGEDLKKMGNKELLNILKDTKIIARADPDDKFRLVKLFKNNGYYVAFIGDGINDSLSLKVADIGISLEDAADIAKESSSAILLRNSFSSVIEAIKEGRKIYYSLKVYLIILLSILLGIFTHILITFFFFSQIFLNVITILALNMAVETIYSISIVNAEMDERYLKRKPEKRMINNRTILGIIRNSLFIGILSTSIAFATVGNVYSIMLFFVLSRPILMWYYKFKYNIELFKSKNIFISIFLSILLISSFLNPYLLKYVGGKYPIFFDFVIVSLFAFLLMIIKIVILYVERSAGT